MSGRQYLGFSTAGGEWILDDAGASGAATSIPFRMPDGSVPPVDPVNNGSPFWDKKLVYGYRGWRSACSEALKGQYFLIGTWLESEGSASSPSQTHDCNNTVVPWPKEVYALTSPDNAP
jgi:hypothetical protein